MVKGDLVYGFRYLTNHKVHRKGDIVNWCLCVPVLKRVCVCLRLCIYIYLDTTIRIFIYCMYVGKYVCMHVCIYVCIDVRMYSSSSRRTKLRSHYGNSMYLTT